MTKTNLAKCRAVPTDETFDAIFVAAMAAAEDAFREGTAESVEHALSEIHGAFEAIGPARQVFIDPSANQAEAVYAGGVVGDQTRRLMPIYRAMQRMQRLYSPAPSSETRLRSVPAR